MHGRVWKRVRGQEGAGRGRKGAGRGNKTIKAKLIQLNTFSDPACYNFSFRLHFPTMSRKNWLEKNINTVDKSNI